MCEVCGASYLISKTFKGVAGVIVMWGSITAFSFGLGWGALFVISSIVMWLRFLRLIPSPE